MAGERPSPAGRREGLAGFCLALWCGLRHPLALGSAFRCGVSAASSCFMLPPGAASSPRGAVTPTLGLLRWATRRGQRVRARAHLLPSWPWGHPLPCQVSSAEPAGGWLCSGTCRERLFMASDPLIGRNGSPPLGDRQSSSRRGRLGAPAGRGWAVMLQVGTSLGASRITWRTFNTDSETYPSRF